MKCIVLFILCGFHPVEILGSGSEVTPPQRGILFPQDSETRERRTLDGVWDFRIAPRNDPDLGFREQWYNGRLRQNGSVELMPVPSSYNDITQNKTIRDHVGWAWYDREFYVPKSWFANQRIWVRFGGVNYHATVWINGVKIAEHSGGHLPFAAEINSVYLSAQSLNVITVAVNNTLSSTTIPQGRIVRQSASRYPPGYFTLDYKFDFFNYAGIHRTVYLYTTPVIHIDDITVNTALSSNNEADVTYTVSIQPQEIRGSYEVSNTLSRVTAHSVQNDYKVSVRLEDKSGKTVASSSGPTGTLRVTNPKLWWPYTMVANETDAAYRYTLVVGLHDINDDEVDVYRLKIGIRSIRWDAKNLYINNKPFYFRGFGRHEDFNIRGRGIDPVMIVKDHNLIKWTGANSYRTSHYPYSEEIMDLTDELGIAIIDEISAVAIDGFGQQLLNTHMDQMMQLMQRDKNRPSVVMWSVANEPQSQKPDAGPYFQRIFALAKSLEVARPVTIVLNQQWSQDQAAQYADIICVNRYYAWYSDTGHTEVITKSLIQDVNNWVNKFKRPIIISEYGSDTVAGLHMSPEFVFTEEFQVEYLKEHFKAFDALRVNGSLIGEHIWNFADFMTNQGITRIVGNRKGIFTRERQPKASAHLVRARYHLLANELDQYPLPLDLQNLLPVYGQKRQGKTEL